MKPASTILFARNNGTILGLIVSLTKFLTCEPHLQKEEKLRRTDFGF